MARDVLFFLAADDEAAAAARLRGPGAAFEPARCHFIDPDTVIAEWDMYFEEPSAEAPSSERLYAWRPWPEWVVPPLNDGVEVLALPKRLTRALADASLAELEELASRWTTRLRSEDGDEMTDDDLLAVLRKVARPVACPTGGVGYGLWLNGAPYWHLTGFTVDTAAKGIVLDASPHVTVDGVEVRNIGDEGVHFRKGSADGVIRNSFVHDAGQNQPDYGVVSGNTFNGSGEQNQNSADSAIDAKGDGYRIDGNTVTDPYLDGFQTHTAQSPYGCGNTFSGNKFTVTASDGYGINVTNNSKSKCGGSSPNVVHASNTSTGGKGLTNITVATP